MDLGEFASGKKIGFCLSAKSIEARTEKSIIDETSTNKEVE